MASASGSGDGAVAAPPAAALGGGGAAGDVEADAPLSERWDALWAAEVAARDARALAALTARGPEGGVDPSRPVSPALPTDAWAVIMDRAASCRCAGLPMSFCTRRSGERSIDRLIDFTPLPDGRGTCGLSLPLPLTPSLAVSRFPHWLTSHDPAWPLPSPRRLTTSPHGKASLASFLAQLYRCHKGTTPR